MSVVALVTKWATPPSLEVEAKFRLYLGPSERVTSQVLGCQTLSSSRSTIAVSWGLSSAADAHMGKIGSNASRVPFFGSREERRRG